jgi:hypothetical protein
MGFLIGSSGLNLQEIKLPSCSHLSLWMILFRAWQPRRFGSCLQFVELKAVRSFSGHLPPMLSNIVSEPPPSAKRYRDIDNFSSSRSPTQDRERYRAVGGQGAAGRPKLRVERQPFLASKAVIFGVNPTGPHILVVNAKCNMQKSKSIEPICRIEVSPDFRPSPATETMQKDNAYLKAVCTKTQTQTQAKRIPQVGDRPTLEEHPT